MTRVDKESNNVDDICITERFDSVRNHIYMKGEVKGTNIMENIWTIYIQRHVMNRCG